jgi:apolipoprotein N-acyltransferase
VDTEYTDPAPSSQQFNRFLFGITRLKKSLISATGWRRRGIAFGLGILATGALPPIYFVFLLIPAMVGLIWFIDSSPRPRAALAIGWWFGLGHAVSGYYWVSAALLVFPDKFGWMVPLAILGLGAVMGFFPALAALLCRIANLRGAARIIFFCVIWVLLEWVRSWIFTGFPWNLLGTVWTFSDAMIQGASIYGVYGLSFITILAAGIPAILTDGGLKAQRRSVIVICAYAILVVSWVGGMARLSTAHSENVENITLRLVQPNIDQKIKWHPEHRRRHVIRQLELSAAAAKMGPAPTHIIWAETAVPYFLARQKTLMAAIGGVTPKKGLTITGTIRGEVSPTGRKVWNSLQAINSQGEIAGSYDKFHLVPFGEYIPLRSVLKFSKLTAGRTDFSPGLGATTLTLPGLPPVGPLICYEVIFPGEVVNRENPPDWLLNLTNDGWYGQSSGPYQHFAAARLRAVEEGLPLVRVANTGISAVVDSFGRVKARLNLRVSGVLDSPLPKKLASKTLYSQFGNMPLLFVLVIFGIGALFARLKT